MVRFYGLTPAEIRGMDLDDYRALEWAMPKLHASEQLFMLRVQDWTFMKPDAREKLGAKLKEVAYSLPITAGQKPKKVSNSELFKILMSR